VEVAVVGALTIDYLNSNNPVPGGPPVYAGLAAASLDVKVKSFTAVGYDFPPSFIERLSGLGIELHIVRQHDRRSYQFKAVFKAGERMLSLISEGPEIPLQALEEIDTDAVIASPVFREIGFAHLSLLRNKTDMLVVDLQGFLRSVKNDGLVVLKPPASTEIISIADVLHCSEEEAVILTGRKRASEISGELRRLGVRTALVGFAEGLLVVSERGSVFLKAQNNYVPAETTGAGDMLTGAFTALLLKGLSAEEAAAKALGYVHFWLRVPPPYRAASPPPGLPTDVQVVWRETAQIP